MLSIDLITHYTLLTAINCPSVCLKSLWNASLICTMSTSHLLITTLSNDSSSVPRPFIDLWRTLANTAGLSLIHLTVNRDLRAFCFNYEDNLAVSIEMKYSNMFAFSFCSSYNIRLGSVQLWVDITNNQICVWELTLDNLHLWSVYVGFNSLEFFHDHDPYHTFMQFLWEVALWDS